MEETKEMTSEYRLSQWAKIMRRRVESGLSIVKYCEREGMPANRYHYWQRKLRAVAAKELDSIEAEKSTVPTGWTQAVLVEERKIPEPAGVTVEVGKCRVGVNETTDMELLTKVCKALVNLC